LTGRKESAIAVKYGSTALSKPFTVFSDNVSDRSLLAKACHAYVVIHKESHRARWLSLSAEYLRISD